MKKISILSLLVMMLTLGLSSCSSFIGEDELTKYLPGDAMMVMKLDGKKLMEATDIKVDHDKVVLPDYLKKYCQGDEAEMLTKIYGMIDVDKIFIAMMGHQDMYCLARVTDYPGLCEMLEAECMTKESQGDYDVYDTNGSVVGIYKKKYVYLMHVSEAMNDFKALVENVAKNPLSKNTAMAEAVSTDDAITMAINYEAYVKAMPVAGVSMPDYIKGKYMAMNMNFEGNKLLMDAGMGNMDGSPIKPIATVDDINIALLGYVPENFNVIIASGKPTINDPDYYEQLQNNMPREFAGVMNMIIPYLKSVDGSSLFALRLSPEIAAGFNPEYFDVLLMTHMPMDKIQEVVSSLMTTTGMYGMPSKELGDGMYAISFEGIDIYYGATDGYFAISTVPVSATHSSELTKYFVNKQTAGVVDGSCLQGILPFYPFAVMQSNGGTDVKSEVTLEGTTEKFLPAVLQLMK